MWLFIAVASAATPLSVSVEPVVLPEPGSWLMEAKRGTITVRPTESGFHLSYPAGTQASLCSPRVPVLGGRSLRLTGEVRGDSTLGDTAGLHLKFWGVEEELHVARRRVEAGDQGWEPLLILATAPPGATEASLCVDLRMVKADAPGGLSLSPLRLVSLSAESRKEKLPLQRILLVTVEALRYDHVSGHGYARATSPRLDALARSGASFQQHYTNAPYTHPSLATLLTSLFPTTLGFLDNQPTMPRAIRTLADRLAEAGYVTAAFSSQYVLSNRYGLNQGFHYYRNWPNDTNSSRLNDELLPWLELHEQDNSFVWVHYFDPHGPYRPPDSFRAPFLTDALYLGDNATLPTGPGSGPFIPNYVQDKSKGGSPNNKRHHYVAGYDADIAWWDSELGRLCDFLAQRGWGADTLVMVTPDHGESMTDHDKYFAHGTLYQHDLHIPLVVSLPGVVPAGTLVPQRSSHLDLLPTLLDYAGVPATGLAGQSLRPAIEGKSYTPPAFTAAVVGRAEKLRYAAVNDGRYKIITDGSFQLVEAYDRVKDPEERLNLVARAPREVARMASEFSAWFAQTFPVSAASEVQALDDEDASRLRSLGYLE